MVHLKLTGSDRWKCSAGLSILILLGCGIEQKSTNLEIPQEVFVSSWKQAEEEKRLCVLEEGFSYVPLPASLFGLNARYLNFPFNLEELERRSKGGYGIVEQQQKSVAYGNADPNSRYRNTLSKADQTVYTSIVYGTLQSPPTCNPIHQLPKESISRANKARQVRSAFITDPRVKKVNAAWQKCMKNAGHDNPGMFWDSPETAKEKVPFIAFNSPDESLKQELELAKADSRCFRPHLGNMNKLRTALISGS